MFCFFLGPEDIDTLLEFTQHLKAFTNMTLSVRRALVATMVFAVVEKAGTVVMTDGEELDSWSVIINGHVEVQVDEGTKELTLGKLNWIIKPKTSILMPHNCILYDVRSRLGCQCDGDSNILQIFYPSTLLFWTDWLKYLWKVGILDFFFMLALHVLKGF